MPAPKISFEATRRDLIHFRNENSRNPALFHRPSLLVEGLGHLQAPASPNQERRLRKIVARTMQETEAIKRTNGKYEPAHCRVRPYRRARS
jgi:hypothetical protein